MADDKYSRRKVDPEEAISAQAERTIDNSAYQSRTEADRKDYYPVGRDISTKDKRSERDIDSSSYIARRQGRKQDWEDNIKRNSR